MGERVVLGLVLDCADMERQAAFWSAALGYEVVGGVANYTQLNPPDPDSGLPKLLLQLVPEAKTVKNRMHLDIDHVDDIEGEADRLVGLGATRLDAGPMEEFGTSWIRLADPEGNEFCVCRSGI